MLIEDAWYIDELKMEIGIQLPNGNLKKFFITPFRTITETDLKPYYGNPPSKSQIQPLPPYLYRFYGLSRNKQSITQNTPVHTGKTNSKTPNSQETPTNISKVIREWLTESE
ncbi:MAG: hypothetical protein H6Q67_1798 [Firmicutes bacterium]|nr:hypothetical protein [Bacillota bacterium]